MSDLAGAAWESWTATLADLSDRLAGDGFPTDDRGRAEGIRHLARQAGRPRTGATALSKSARARGPSSVSRGAPLSVRTRHDRDWGRWDEIDRDPTFVCAQVPLGYTTAPKAADSWLRDRDTTTMDLSVTIASA